MRRLIALGAIFLTSSASAFKTSLFDDLTAGSKKYWSNTLGVGLDPSERVSFGLTLGAGNTGSPYDDRTKSGGLTFWTEFGGGVSAALDGNYYSGNRADILDLITLDQLGRADDRQTTGSFGGTIAWRFLDSGGEETADDMIYSANVELGASGNKTTVPVWGRLPVRGDDHLGDYVFRDRAYTAGTSMSVEGSSIGVRYLRHHYRLPDGLTSIDPRLPKALKDQLRSFDLNKPHVEEFFRTSVGGTISGVPVYQTSVWLSERVHDKITLHGSLDYLKLETGGLARTWGACLSWAASDRFELRAGSLWDRQAGKTARSTTLGASVTF